MNLILRLILVLLGQWRRSRLGLLEESVVDFRVWPLDLDFNLHMNNGRYLTVMDLGRIDLMGRQGTLGLMLRQRWTPVVAGQTIAYRRPLKPFQRYSLHSRVVCWDEKFVYLEQRFQATGKVMASAIVKAAVLAEQRPLRPRDMLRQAGLERRPPPMPPAIKAWALAEEWSTEPRGPAATMLGRPAEKVDVAEASGTKPGTESESELRKAS